MVNPIPLTEKSDEFQNRITRSGGRHLQDSSFSLSGITVFHIFCFNSFLVHGYFIAYVYALPSTIVDFKQMILRRDILWCLQKTRKTI